MEVTALNKEPNSNVTERELLGLTEKIIEIEYLISNIASYEHRKELKKAGKLIDQILLDIPSITAIYLNIVTAKEEVKNK